jgi:sugar phosphate isomerase/epimerase
VFKLGVITSEISRDIKKAVKVAEDLQLQYIDLRFCWEKNVKDLTDDEVHRIKRIAQLAGLEILCICPPFFKCRITDEKEVHKHLSYLQRLIEITKLFDAQLIRGFSFWKTEDRNHYYDMVIERVSEAADICESEGVTLAIENEHGTFVGTGKEAQAFYKDVNSKGLRLLWDPGNAFCAGETSYPDGYNKVRHQMIHMHLKDAIRESGFKKCKWVAVGTGKIDYEGQFKALIEDDYNGGVSIETHYRINDNGEKSTRETYLELKNILNRLIYK